MRTATLPMDLYYAYTAGKLSQLRDRCLQEARKTDGEWRCKWIREARECHKSFLANLRKARAEARRGDK